MSSVPRFDGFKDSEELVNFYQLALDAFVQYDKNGDGNISISEELPMDDATARIFDNDKFDGMITEAELSKGLRQLTSIPHLLRFAPELGERWFYFKSEEKTGDMLSISHSFGRTSDGEFDLLKDALSTVDELKRADAEKFANKLYEIASAYREACIRTGAEDMLTGYDWVRSVLSHESWFGGTPTERSYQAMDILAKWLRKTDDLEALQRNVAIMVQNGGVDTVVAHDGIVDTLQELRTRPLPRDKNFVAVYDRTTLKTRIVVLDRGKMYTTTPDEAAVGSHKWKDKDATIDEFSVPHTPKAMEMVPWFVTMGRAYLNDVIQSAADYIHANDIMSRVDPKRTIADIDTQLLKKITYVEIMGSDFMRAGEEGRWLDVDDLVGSIHFRLGAYGKEAFGATTSFQGARGMCQFIEETYKGLRRDYGHLIEDFAKGTADHFNAILAQFMSVDEILRTFNTRCNEPGNAYNKYRDIALTKIQDEKTFGQFMAISYNRGKAGFRWLVGLDKLTGEPETYRRKFLVVDDYFRLQPSIVIMRLASEAYDFTSSYASAAIARSGAYLAGIVKDVEATPVYKAMKAEAARLEEQRAAEQRAEAKRRAAQRRPAPVKPKTKPAKPAKPTKPKAGATTPAGRTLGSKPPKAQAGGNGRPKPKVKPH